MTEKTTEKSALDEIKAIDAQTRKISLIEVISNLKQKAKVIKENKFYTEAILAEMGYSEKDMKAIIDYINSQITIDEKYIKDDAKKDISDKKEKAIKKIKESPFIGNLTQTLTSYPAQNATWTTGTAIWNQYNQANTVKTNYNQVTAGYVAPTLQDLKFIETSL